jgi:TRAP-type C4-dicarboxylate transport system permease small subunit
MPPFTVARVLVLIACIIFVLACFGIAPGGFNAIALGLAFWSASNLV